MKISVITAIYNSETTIAQAIQSVASQSHADLEHLIIDGGSTDQSLARIGAAAHKRMVLSSQADRGIYDALNRGISRSTGDVVGFLHSDDFLPHDQVLARVAEAFHGPDVEAVFADLQYVSRSHPTRIVRHWSTGPFTPGALKRGWMPAHPTLYLRRSVYENLGGFDTAFQIAADYDFMLRYFSRNAGRSRYIPEVLYTMRMGGESNRDLRRIMRKSAEDYRALKKNSVGGVGTLLAKNISKLTQFLPR